MPDTAKLMDPPDFRIAMAATAEDIKHAQRLRYDVFVTELGGTGAGVDHAHGLECDEFDAHVDHMLLFDDAAGCLAGVYRMVRPDQAERLGRYYSESEYDLFALRGSGKRLLELGRSCLAPNYRGGMAMYRLWNGLAAYVEAHRIDILFGVASFHGTDPHDLAAPLSLLHHRHLAPEDLRPRALPPHCVDMNVLSETAIDRRAAMVAMPSLIKAYLRVGGVVGEGAYVDHAFNTTDVCLLLETSRFNARRARIYQGSPT